MAVARGDAECSLRCINESKCVAGRASFDGHPKEDDGSDLPFHNDNLSQDNYHCACDKGFTGLTCGVVFESCGDASDLHNCYHGAPCVPTGQDDFGNQQYECNCSAASDGDNYYTGKYCQNEHSTEVACDHSQGISCKNGGVCKVDDNGDNFCECSDRFHGSLCELDSGVNCGDKVCFNGSPCIQTDQGEAYCDCSQTNDPDRRFMGSSCDKELSVRCDDSKTCLNGAACVDNGNGSFSCDCTEDWRGASCEFASYEQATSEAENCGVDMCLNGGTCVRSVIDSSDEALGVEDRCVCPDGWTGPKCEYKYEDCGNGQHICVHGSKCVQEAGSKDWTCECDEEYREDQNYVGEFCQHHKMTVCTTADAAFQMYDGAASSIYCVNDAICVEIEENGRTFPACQCPNGYRGPHCEFIGQPVLVIEETSGLGIAASAATVFGFILMALAITTCLSFGLVQRRALRRVIVEMPKAPLYLDDPIRALGKDDDDVSLYSLEDVELI